MLAGLADIVNIMKVLRVLLITYGSLNVLLTKGVEMRKFRTNVKNETINVTLYEGVDRDSPSLANIELSYTDNKLKSMLISFDLSNPCSLILTDKKDFDVLKKIFSELDECFAVTGYKGFE